MTEEQKECISPDALVMKGKYADALIGHSWDGRAIYNARKIVEIDSEELGGFQESYEFHEYNTFTALGGMVPIFLFEFEE